MSESAWKWGAYKKGMGKDTDDRRIRFAVRAIKNELVYVEAPNSERINLETTVFGPVVHQAVKGFQSSVGLAADGLVGRATANALFAVRIRDLQAQMGIPRNWMRAQVHWESGDDPGAEFVNSDGSADRGLCQLNSTRKPLTEDEAFNPADSLAFLANHLRHNATAFDDCKVGPWKLAVGAWRTPVGARDWCELGSEVVPDNGEDATWAERAAYYVDKVNTVGRMGWVG